MDGRRPRPSVQLATIAITAVTVPTHALGVAKRARRLGVEDLDPVAVGVCVMMMGCVIGVRRDCLHVVCLDCEFAFEDLVR